MDVSCTIVASPPEQPPEAHEVRVEPLVMQPDAVQLAENGALVASGALRVDLAPMLALKRSERST